MLKQANEMQDNPLLSVGFLLLPKKGLKAMNYSNRSAQIFFLLQLCFLSFLLLGAQNSSKHTIVITQIVEHPSLNIIRNGLTESLEQNGFTDSNTQIKYFNAQGDMTIAAQIANKVIGERPDVIVSITTPMSQAIVAKKSEIPVVFSAVNNPLEAKLLKNLQKPEGHVTGVLYVNPVRKHLELIKQLLPNAKKVGIIYNSGEANSVSDAQIFKAEGTKMGFFVSEMTISNSSQLFSATKSLAEKVDALYFPTDNTVVSAVETVLNICKQQRIPAFSADSDSVVKGALATVSLDHYHIGKLTADLVISILNGKKIADIPVIEPNKFEFIINKKTAKELGISVSQEILKQSPKIVE